MPLQAFSKKKLCGGTLTKRTNLRFDVPRANEKGQIECSSSVWQGKRGQGREQRAEDHLIGLSECRWRFVQIQGLA
jgi:hypothetical protein